jgi:hypothetical protein
VKPLLAILLLALAPAPKPASLAELRADSVAWRGQVVEFTLQFDAPLESWHSWLTRFDERRYMGFSAWGDEQLLWKQAAFDSPARRLFARRGSAAELALRGAPPYRRFGVTAVVRNVFESQPWIEILSAEPLARSIGQGTLVHAGRALDLEAEGHDAAAAEQYERALAAPMPAVMQQALEAARDAARARAKSSAE